MNDKQRMKLLGQQLNSLEQSTMSVRQVGRGSFHFVSYDPTFRHATVRRFGTVEAMAASYRAWLVRDEEHLEIHLAMLDAAGMLSDQECEEEITPQSFRLTFNRKAFAA